MIASDTILFSYFFVLSFILQQIVNLSNYTKQHVELRIFLFGMIMSTICKKIILLNLWKNWTSITKLWKKK